MFVFSNYFLTIGRLLAVIVCGWTTIVGGSNIKVAGRLIFSDKTVISELCEYSGSFMLSSVYLRHYMIIAACSI